MTEASVSQVAGTHYSSEFQHWDKAVRFRSAEYLQLTATKYLDRLGKKDEVIKELNKSLSYLQKLIVNLRLGIIKDSDLIANKTPGSETVVALYENVNANRVGAESLRVARLIETATGLIHLEQAEAALQMMISRLEGSSPTSAYVNQDR